jgi:hypothetical protein
LSAPIVGLAGVSPVFGLVGIPVVGLAGVSLVFGFLSIPVFGLVGIPVVAPVALPVIDFFALPVVGYRGVEPREGVVPRLRVLLRSCVVRLDVCVPAVLTVDGLTALVQGDPGERSATPRTVHT